MIALRTCPDDCTCRGKLKSLTEERREATVARAFVHFRWLDALQEAHEAGHTYQDLARAAGITRQRVQQLCDRSREAQ